jgi:predicted DNA-binding transcriptional regulator AlpA
MSDTAVAEPQEKLLSMSDVLARVPISNVTLIVWSRDGRFPSPRRVTDRFNSKPFWLESEVNRWIQSLPKKIYKNLDETARRRRGSDDAEFCKSVDGA